MSKRVLCVAAFLVVLVVVAPAALAQEVHEPPVDRPVIDPFRPPHHAYGPGNRGLEYGTRPGDTVRASAAGEVVFAGQVGGDLFVTVRHLDGLRTGYGYLEAIEVRAGDTVTAGAAIGRAGPGFHFTARVGDRYIDPDGLFGEDVVTVRLIDDDEPWSMADEAAVADARGLGAMVTADSGPACTTEAVRPERRPQPALAVLVPGVNTTDDPAAIDDLDWPALGYGEAHRFSYGSGAAASRRDIADSARRLADDLESLAGTEVHVYAHSMGGVVVRLALAELVDREAELPTRVVTLGSPLDGSDLASLGQAARQAFPITERWTGGTTIDVSSPALTQLAEGSVLIESLPPIPAGIAALNVAARSDLIVPAPRSEPDIIVPVDGFDAHHSLPGHPSTTRALQLSLAAMAPACGSAWDASVGRVISAVYDAAAAVLRLL